MAFDDAKIGSISYLLGKVIRAELHDIIKREATDTDIADYLLTASTTEVAKHLANIEPNVAIDDLHSIVERTISSFSPGNGFIFNTNENPLWIQVSVCHPNRTPTQDVVDRLWIRLSSIVEIIPTLALGGAQDRRSWGWNLKIKTNRNESYWASERTFKGLLIERAQRLVMNTVDTAIQSERLPTLYPAPS